MKVPYSVLSIPFWRAYWITLRPYLMFVSGVSGLTGLALAGAMDQILFWCLLASFFLSYGLGQALTDVFQTDTDSISSPYRPLTQGSIRPRQVLIVSLFGLALCGVAFFMGNIRTLPLTVLGVIGLATYTPFKRKWWGGPLWNSWIVALLPVIGYLCGSNGLSAPFGSVTLWLTVGSTFFSYAIFVLLGYFKDISADRATGYNTFPVVFGWNRAVLMSLVYCFATTLFSVPLMYLANAALSAWGLWTVGTLALYYSHYL
ncbi:MAG: UbiA family prenyltransferase, partial [Bdellovibrionota bacterium]